MSNINIKRAVENIRSGTNIYTPIVELIVNAIQAIRAINPKGGTITVTILRAAQPELTDSLAVVNGFVVEDDGIGFDQHNRDSFDTLYTDWKASDGGKGFGRFTCLKYFDHFNVESIFRDNEVLRQRRFKMGMAADIIIDEQLSDTTKTATGSTVTISGIKSVKFPEKSIDVISRVLVERLLPYFIEPNSHCPRIVVKDSADGSFRILNEYLASEKRQIIELPTTKSQTTIPSRSGDEEAFNIRIFKFYAPKTAASKISLVAHRREVTETPLQTYIPEFATEFYDKADDAEGRDRNYIIKAYVFGDYLDNNVSLERGAFNFSRDNDFIHGISQSQIEKAAADIAQQTVGNEISERKERKVLRIRNYVETSAPWHRILSEEADFSSLPMNPSDEAIELHLQTSKFRLETKARAAVRDILSSTDPDALITKAAQAVELISQTNKNDLIHYVALRKCVLDLFAKALEKDETGKYKSEGSVHDIIIPRKADTDELDYAQHNLWILDERLNFSAYASSDKPLQHPNGDRTDVTVFNRPVAFRGENEPSNPVTIFEFKKPQRDDFANPSSQEDPIEQVKRYVNQIRDGKCTLPNGRTIRVSDNTPFYGYVVCDLTKKVKEWLYRDKNFTEMPDGLGWFEWYENIRLYIEVLSWDKVLADAEMRNKIFFKKLGI
ncbi:MAG: ATP-binding protein [Alphaproteobacteria bacterium]